MSQSTTLDSSISIQQNTSSLSLIVTALLTDAEVATIADMDATMPFLQAVPPGEAILSGGAKFPARVKKGRNTELPKPTT